jgi:hypothetical protein
MAKWNEDKWLFCISNDKGASIRDMGSELIIIGFGGTVRSVIYVVGKVSYLMPC